MNNDKEKILSSIYYDIKHPASFSSLNYLYKAVKNIDPSISISNVKEWLKSQFVHTLHKQPKRRFKRSRIIFEGIDEIWEADLVDLTEFQSKNQGYKFLLNVIDAMSKFAFSIPLKNKTSKEIVRGFEKILKESKRRPISIRSDQGKEFLNKDFKQFLKKYNLSHYTSNNKEIKCAIVERFNRTLKSKMFKYFTSRGTRKYIDILDDLLNNYNNSYHRTIKMTPTEASSADRKLLKQNIFGYIDEGIDKKKIGQTVRRVYQKKPFDKSYYPNWTDQTFSIKTRSSDTKPLYKVQDERHNISKERFYSDQIQDINATQYRVEKILKTRLYKGQKQCLVKWLNYPQAYNSWINENDIIYL